MITKLIWEDFLGSYPKPIDYFICMLATIFAIPLDVLLSPIEIIAFIIWKIRERD